MAVHQCPKCPLRFDLAPMLADHLSTDHDVDPAAVAHLQPEAVRIGLVTLPPDRTARRDATDPGGEGPAHVRAEDPA